jgi:hypothetical protein
MFCSRYVKEEGTVLSAEDRLKKIISYDSLPPCPTSLKAGFHFAVQDYPLLNSFNVEETTISALMDANVVRQEINLTDKSNELTIYFIISSTNCVSAREQTISWASWMTSLPMDAFISGSDDIGEFNIITDHPSGRATFLIHFVRNNIGVSIVVDEGDFNIESLAKQIDKKIQNMKDSDSNAIKSISPQIKSIVSSVQKIVLNQMFTITVVMDGNHNEDELLFFVQYDEDRVNLEEQEGKTATFKALIPGETIIYFSVVDRKSLLATADSIKISIAEN